MTDDAAARARDLVEFTCTHVAGPFACASCIATFAASEVETREDSIWEALGMPDYESEDSIEHFIGVLNRQVERLALERDEARAALGVAQRVVIAATGLVGAPERERTQWARLLTEAVDAALSASPAPSGTDGS